MTMGTKGPLSYAEEVDASTDEATLFMAFPKDRIPLLTESTPSTEDDKPLRFLGGANMVVNSENVTSRTGKRALSS